MSSNRIEEANADSERFRLWFIVVDHNFIPTTSLLSLHIQQGMIVDDFLEAVLVKYPGIFNRPTAKFYHAPGGFSLTDSGEFEVESEGWVAVSPKQSFTRNAMALQAAPKRWAKIPDDTEEDLYYVIRNPAPASGKVIGGDDENSGWTGASRMLRSIPATIESFSPESAEKQLPLLYEKMATTLAPSVTGKKSPAELHQAKFYVYTNYNCPRETDSVSLILLAKVFGQFKDDCNREPDTEMSQVMHTFAEAAFGTAVDLSEPGDEKALMENFNRRFEKLYGITLARLIHPYETDGHLVRNGRLQLIRELKSRNPSGDALVQGAEYYRIFYRDHLKEWNHLPEGDVLPAFLITYQGPLINVYGIACVEKGQVQCEYLTSVNAGCHWTNKEELYKLMRILYALRKAFDRLNEVPELFDAPTFPPRKRQRMTRCIWPYPHAFTKLGSNINVEFQYLKQLDGDRYLFEVQPVNKPSSKNLLVKFTQSYGQAVHEELARAKYAPELLGLSDLPGGWKMVVMEFLESPVWKDGSSLLISNEIIKQGLSVVRYKILPLLEKKGYVHGDIRLSNLLFRTAGVGDDLDPAVKLVDFDFAGEAGKTTYPWNLNIAVRPPGHLPCAPLALSHDDVSLKVLEGHIQGALGNGAGLRHK